MTSIKDHPLLEKDPRSQDFKDELAKIFGQIPNDIPIYLFTEKGRENVFSQAAERVLQVFQGLSSKIQFKKYDLGHKLAKKWAVDRSPTVLFAPEHYSIRWLGAPIGEEGRTLVEAILLIGFGRSSLSDQSLKVMKRIDSPRMIRVFVSTTCPYCPQQAVNALKAFSKTLSILTGRRGGIRAQGAWCKVQGVHLFTLFSIP